MKEMCDERTCCLRTLVLSMLSTSTGTSLSRRYLFTPTITFTRRIIG